MSPDPSAIVSSPTISAEVVNSVQIFCSLIRDVLLTGLLQLLRHPYDTLDSALSLHKLLGRDEVLYHVP